MRILLLFIFIPTLSWGLTFKDGKSVSASSFSWTNWGSTVNHDSSAKNEWSQSIDEDFSRLVGDKSHYFELRAKDCGAYDCKRGNFEGEYGRVEAYLNNPSNINYKGESGENWYVWSIFIDGNDIQDLKEDHIIQLGQFKLEYAVDALSNKWPHCREYSEVVFMLQYRANNNGLGVTREVCKDDYLFNSTSRNQIIVEKNKLFGRWIDIILHVDWSEDGFFKIYVDGDLKYLEEGYITPQFHIPSKGKKAGPSFRYGVYVNQTPKDFNGTIKAWYSNIARANKCSNKKFSKIIDSLGYSCDSLGDLDGEHVKGVLNINPEVHKNYREVAKDFKTDFANLTALYIDNEKKSFNENIDFDKYKSDGFFDEGQYELHWTYIRTDANENIINEGVIGVDIAEFKNGKLEFLFLDDKIFDIEKENREKILLDTQDGYFKVDANLDFSSDGVTTPMIMIGTLEKDKSGSYYVEGDYNKNEKIGISFVPIKQNKNDLLGDLESLLD